MQDLLDWLAAQQGGMRTFTGFHNRALALRASEHENVALLRLLADLTERFIQAYDGEPTSPDVAGLALARLTEFLRRAVDLTRAGPGERLALLNEIGATELFTAVKV